MTRRCLCLAIAMVAAAAAQSVDLSGEWHITPHDDMANALPQTSDREWSTVVLPRGTEPVLPAKDLIPGFWLRKTVQVPPGADTLVVGQRLASFELYLNGRRVPASGRLAAIPPDLRGAEVTIAIHALPDSTRIPLFGYYDPGPWLIAPEMEAREKLEQADNLVLARTRPRILFGGAEMALGITLVLVWALTSRASWTLVWIALCAFGAAYTSALAGLLGWRVGPSSALVAAASFQLAFAAVKLDVPWTRVAIFAAVAALNYEWHNMFSVSNTVVLGALIAACGMFMPRPRNERILAAAIAFQLAWEASAGRFGGIVIDFRGSFWPVTTFANTLVPALALVAVELWRMRADQRQKQRLESEMQAAGTVQRLLVPSSAPEGIDAAYHPAAEVGGDYWQAFTLPGGGQLVIIGDVSGKGLQAAMLVSLITGLLDSRRSDRPGYVLGELNRALCVRMKGGFVTAAVALIHADGSAVIANAGHPAPYLDGVEVELDSGMPLGLTTSAEYPERALRLDPGQQLTFVSDGVVEATSARGELFGFDRTREISAKPAAAIAATARAWGQNDDITVVTVRRSA